MNANLIRPNKFDSIQEYLEALGFTTNAGNFVCGEIVFPCVEIRGHTLTTFAEKMKRHEWMPMEVEEKKAIRWPLV